MRGKNKNSDHFYKFFSTKLSLKLQQHSLCLVAKEIHNIRLELIKNSCLCAKIIMNEDVNTRAYETFVEGKKSI
jgi:hypothetical protein